MLHQIIIIIIVVVVAIVAVVVNYQVSLIRQHEHLFTEVKYISLSVSALRVFDQLSQVSWT